MTENGEREQEEIDLRDIDPRNANYIEMMALTAHLAEQGEDINHGMPLVFPNESGANGIPGEAQLSDYFLKRNYLELTKEVMERQYSLGNLSGYQSYSKQYWTYMNFNATVQK